jgi:predicted metal-dependent hydrolase
MEYITSLETPVVFNKSFRARRLTVSIKPFKPIRVTFPARVSQGKAQEFLESNIEWVKKAILKMKEIEKQTPAKIDLPKINKTQAKIFLTSQLRFLADKYNFTYNKVFIRNQKTRWGSCSGGNNINLNINIVRLPEELQDYILLHELVHTRIKNHSRKFWNELDRYVANSKLIAKKLRNHSLSLLHYAA